MENFLESEKWSEYGNFGEASIATTHYITGYYGQTAPTESLQALFSITSQIAFLLFEFPSQ